MPRGRANGTENQARSLRPPEKTKIRGKTTTSGTFQVFKRAIFSVLQELFGADGSLMSWRASCAWVRSRLALTEALELVARNAVPDEARQLRL